MRSRRGSSAGRVASRAATDAATVSASASLSRLQFQVEQAATRAHQRQRLIQRGDALAASGVELAQRIEAEIAHGAAPLVVRLTVPSWMMTSSPIRLNCTSHSMPSAPRSKARSKASSVFSGACPRAPRCP